MSKKQWDFLVFLIDYGNKYMNSEYNCSLKLYFIWPGRTISVDDYISHNFTLLLQRHFLCLSHIKVFLAVILSWHTECCSCICCKNKTTAIYLSVYTLSYLLGSECPEARPFPYSYLSKHSARLKLSLSCNHK